MLNLAIATEVAFKVNKLLVIGAPLIRGKRRPRALLVFWEDILMKKTAILVDGGFYRKRAHAQWGKKSPERRAEELIAYCLAHLNTEKNRDKDRQLYRIFYYDCPPISKTVYHPLLKKNMDFKKTETYLWTCGFFQALKQKRKTALRLGELSQEHAQFKLKKDVLKPLLAGEIPLDSLTEDDFEISFQQKGVDMKIGVDIASMAYKGQVDQIVLIAGDSDFVPAAKLARREGIDFILDPMNTHIKDNLNEHIDGLRSNWRKRTKSKENK